MHHRVISAVTKEEFQGTEQQSLTYVDGEPGVNQWTFDTTIKAVKANANRGYFRFHLGRVALGDKINVKAEVYNIEGVKVHASVDYSDSGYNANKGTTGLVNTKSTADWEQINIDFYANMDALYASCVIGLSTGEVGKYYLKNVVITVTTVHRAPNEIILPDFRKICAACLWKYNGSWLFNSNFDNSPCAITELDANTLRVTFAELSGGAKWSFGWTSQEYHNNDYFIRVKSSGAGIIDLRFRNPTTNETVPLANLVNGMTFVVYAME
jgi:hypothetical protein